MAGASVAGISQRHRRVERLGLGAVRLALRPCFARASAPLAPMSRHAERMSSGITNGGEGQSSSLRAPAISSAPGASLCAFCVPCRVGMPKPMIVLQAISDGRGLRLRPFQRGGDLGGVMAVDDLGHPSRRFEPLDRVGGIGERRRPVDGDGIVVIKHDQLGQLEMPGQRDRLVAHALHQIAVARDHIGLVIHQIVAEARVQDAFGQRHADCGGDPLAQAARWWSRSPRHGRIRGGRRKGSRPAGRSRYRPSKCCHIRSDKAANKAASSHARPTARSGRGPASAGLSDRISGTGSRAPLPHPPCPWAGPDGRIWPFPPRPWSAPG